MLLFRVLGLQRDPGVKAEHFGVAWSRAKAFHEVVFVTFESVILLGVIEAARRAKPESLTIMLILATGYIALGLYLTTGVRYWLALLFESRGWDEVRFVNKWVLGPLIVLGSFSIPFMMSSLIGEAIASNLGG